MDISLLKNCFHNALFVEETGGGLTPWRHTRAQYAFHNALDYGFIMGEKALMTAGITLEFDTNAQAFTLLWRITGGYQPTTADRRSSLDVYVDGVLRNQHIIACPWQEQQRTRFAVDDDANSGCHRIQIWLPHTLIARVDGLILPDDALFKPVPKRRRTVLFLGDSITQGIGAEYASTGYAMLTARLLDCEAVNQSIAALKFEAGCLDSAGFAPDVISVAYGTNDWAGCPDREAYDKGARAFFKRLDALYPLVPVAVLSPVKRCREEADRPEMHRERDLFKVLRAICAPYPQMKVIDGWTLMPHTAAFFQDGLHPNDLGSAHYAAGVLPILRDMLR